ncbi:GNAT family N-acetyltransferase [Lactobacillus delbrueckii]|uniref:GNAT family N-acetyltransferase n=1 Tax=Lactobacillus delbrueckii TaxID=1584 RepID=UPI001108B3DF|nr:GNAT family N-acetyltransferase [Lactobacillus delbrueckii]MCD5501790.1 GNAT family N-acetyltransferase [Lactobacillus delbrueckii subsp. lactis]MCT3516175.1 GNAT family N-acetyltransferase [Lactobacillus delbrueckii subsp. lactis]TLQ29542.1 GNAT family N-acetyltransferase [Lactobacillus delbrueckii subsp. lactis]
MTTELIELDESYAEDFWRLRKELFKELGEVAESEDLSALEEATKQYFLAHIGQDMVSWGMLEDGKLAATGSFCLFSRIPYSENLTGQEGYILNIYTSPKSRKQGYAKRIVDEIIDYARRTGIKRLWLNASEDGAGVYVKRGFTKKGNEMELFV